MISGLLAHVWQSTLCAGAAWLLTLALRRNQAQIRYWIWFLASVKFLVPFSLLVGLGESVPWRTASPATETGWGTVANQVRPLVTLSDVGGDVAAGGANRGLAAAALVVWFCGFSAIAICWANGWKRLRALRQRATPLRIARDIEFAVPILSAPGLVEPGVFGVFRPVLLLPQGIAERLNQSQLEAILSHELCHVRRRDNLTAAIHMTVHAAFWFHPLVWWLGARLVDERERACDEEVLRLGNTPRVYAEGILKVCQLYAQSPLVCASGVTGANLKVRIETIMKNPIRRELGRGRLCFRDKPR
jgi:bla regulator protein BlaR1